MDNNTVKLENLVKIMDELRERCPWDKKQTIQSLRPLTIEETFELTDAILKENSADIQEELGDLLLHIVFYSKIADELGWFNLGQVIDGICDKLVRRHPHIYGDLQLNSAEEVKMNWEKLKQKEGKKGLLDGVPNSMPALIKALRMQDKARQVGFDWSDKKDVWAKLQEELGELEEAISLDDQNKIEEEFGDCFFALINYARFLKIDPELALDKVNLKFRNRISYIESNSQRVLSEMSMDQMNFLWEEAKLKGL